MPPSTLSSLWRYPVKSMAGAELEAVDVTVRGLVGDRPTPWWMPGVEKSEAPRA